MCEPHWLQLQLQDKSLAGTEAVIQSFLLAAGMTPFYTHARAAASFSLPITASQALTSKKESVVTYGCGALLIVSCVTSACLAWCYPPQL